RQSSVGLLVLLLCAGPHAQSIITGPGASGGPNVKRFTNAASDASFFAYTPSFTGGVTVAYGDVNGDGVADIITGTASGSSEVKVFDGKTLSQFRDFLAYDPAFTGGVYVAAGDVNGDGFDDIITGAGPGGGPNVKVFDGKTGSVLMNFFAFSPSFTGGVTVAAG